MNIYIICSVRIATSEYLNKLYKYIAELEAQGHNVHFPPRDTNQNDEETGGYRICKDNLAAIRWADEVWISYNVESTGTHFDLGMAFALNKKVVLFDDISKENNNNKSFKSMIKYWENICSTCLNGYSFVGINFDECPKCGETFNEKNS